MNVNGTGSATSAIFDMEMERLDQEIEKTRKQFYTVLLGKKRRVKRKWLEISAMTNAHLLQTLPYRAMLGHVAKLAEERDKFIAQTETENSLRDNNEKCEHEKVDEESPIENAVKSQTLLSEEQRDSRLARDEAIQVAPIFNNNKERKKAASRTKADKTSRRKSYKQHNNSVMDFTLHFVSS